jgi:Bacterial extracellular solute-binding protein/von Willebrand factor type A domain
VRTGVLVTAAIVIAAAVMTALGSQAILASATCGRNPVLVNVAASSDIGPAVQRVAGYFNRLHRLIGGRCAEVQVTQYPSAAAEAMVDGKVPLRGLPSIDAWIPDSGLWVELARSMPVGAKVIQTTGIGVAKSPLMIVMPHSVAARLPTFGKSLGWNFLLPETAGGPPAAAGVQVQLPDPTQSAAGLAAVIEEARLLGRGVSATENFTRFVYGAQLADQSDSPAALNSLVSLARPPFNERPVTVTSEQAVIQYDQTHPGQPLAARYPSDGSPELDYPYVLTTTDPLRLRAAREFGKILTQPYTADVVRYAGFRSARGVPDQTPASFGLASQQLRLTDLANPGLAQTTLQAWGRVRIGFRLLALLDVSGSMAQPALPAGPTRMQEMLSAAGEGLLLFPGTTRMGLWEFASNLDGRKPYKPLVPIGPLAAEVGLISRRQQIQQINQTLQPRPGTTATMNNTILAAYRYMIATYDRKRANSVLIMTGGADDAIGDISARKLLKKLRAIAGPNRRVALLFNVFGQSSHFAAMQRLARATGGAAFQITDPAEINKIFFADVGRDLAG